MKKFLKYMSPFAPDQSGACSVFYELGGLIVICDAGGCAGNICGFDEPRWFDKKSAVFSAGLRDMDAIMGRDDKLIEKLSLAHSQLGGNFALIVSTPVPAMYRLFERFAKESFEKKDGKIGIIGATPMETGYKNSSSLRNKLESIGLHNYVVYSMGSSVDDIQRASECEKNIVISLAGLKAAKYLKDKFNIPYEIAFPFIPEDIIKKASDYKDKKILIIRSQFAGNELRKQIGNGKNITCATWFMQDKDYANDGDVKLNGEDDLYELIKNEDFDLIIADSDALSLIKDAGFKGDFIDYPEFAVSGRIFD